MTLRSILWAFAALLFTAAPAQAAPAQLVGKSVVISFTENRVQRNSDWPDFRSIVIGGEVDVYISSAGRAFSRVRMTNRGGETGHRDRVGNEAGGAVSFAGNTMTIVRAQGGAARRAVVTFGTGFTSCQASMMFAKPSGQSVIRDKNMVRPGVTIEIRSVQVSGISCSVRDGNVFGGG